MREKFINFFITAFNNKNYPDLNFASPFDLLSGFCDQEPLNTKEGEESPLPGISKEEMEEVKSIFTQVVYMSQLFAQALQAEQGVLLLL